MQHMVVIEGGRAFNLNYLVTASYSEYDGSLIMVFDIMMPTITATKIPQVITLAGNEGGATVWQYIVNHAAAQLKAGMPNE